MDLEKACLKTDNVILAYNPVEFHAENIIQFCFTRIHMGIIFVPDWAAEFLVHLWQVSFWQEAVGFFNVRLTIASTPKTENQRAHFR